MNLTFIPLEPSHFPLLLKWLEAPHIKKWWDPDITWTPELIQKKYEPYVKGYKEVSELKALQAFIICAGKNPAGYLQFYPLSPSSLKNLLDPLPIPAAGLDFFIGEEKYLRQGLGSQALKKFLETVVDPAYDFTLVDPDPQNLVALKLYEKAGFQKTGPDPQNKHVFMGRKKPKTKI